MCVDPTSKSGQEQALCEDDVGVPRQQYWVVHHCEVVFQRYEIRVFAYPEDDPQNKKEMELDYEYKWMNMDYPIL